MKYSPSFKKVFQLKPLLNIFFIASIYFFSLNIYTDVQAKSNNSNNRSPSDVVSYANSVEKAAPSVVSIQTTKTMPKDLNPMMQDPFFQFFFGEQGPVPRAELQKGLGSGVIIDNKGHILTNHHVVKDASEIVVKLPDGRTKTAKIVGSDSETDLAVLKIDGKNLPSIPIGSSDVLRVGDVVLAIGNPFGLSQSVTQGIISSTRRSDSEAGLGLMLESFIQTDAAINPGNSGGALINAYGELIGINTAIISRSGGNQGIGFAIPIDNAMKIMQQLITEGQVTRGYLGVTLAPLNKEIRDYINYKDESGVYIQAIVRNSPAQKSGLLPGDILVKVNKTQITDLNQALQVVSNLKPEQRYSLEIFRRGQFYQFTVAIAKRPTNLK